jgi:2-polyprenyl-3-methyl-5-hydroxy-6-metoxy-1,4-benzoquinol methylase
MTDLTRKDKLLTGIQLSDKGLELGPLCWPLVSKDEANVQYVDHVSTSELKKLYKGDKGVVADLIPEIDYPLNGKSLSEVAGKGKFSYIIASHVIEHIPDVIRWLQDIATTLTDGGRLALAIPDKRFTFDIDRPPSTIGDVVGPYIDELTTPYSSTIFNYASSFRLNTDAHRVWQGELYLDSKSPHRYSSSQAYSMCIDSAKHHTYVDTHCTVFTPYSFMEILKELIKLNLLDFKVASFYTTTGSQYEFIVTLQKVEKNRREQLASIPIIEAPLTRRELESQLVQLETLQRTNDTLSSELKSIRASQSWKMTKPVRKAKNKIRSVLRS